MNIFNNFETLDLLNLDEMMWDTNISQLTVQNSIHSVTTNNIILQLPIASRIILSKGATPVTPLAGRSALYCKDDGKYYYKSDDGVEHTLSLPYGGVGVSFEASQKPVENGVYSYIMPYGFTVQTNATGSGFYNATNPSVTVSVSIRKNGTEFGTLSVDSNGSATWTVTQTDIATGDRISFVFGAQDTNWAGVAITLKGVR